MKKKELNLRQKIFLLIFGAIVAGILLEAGLQISSFINAHVFLSRYDFSDIKPGELVIFCVGGSFTYGIGAGKDNSYPVQLEEILNERGKGRRFKVYNLGVPGYNSAQVLKKLRLAVSLYEPDVVVVLCGGNDNWNIDGMELQVGARLMEVLFSRLKTFRMSIIISENIRYVAARNSVMESKNRIGSRILKQENNAHKLIQYGNVYRQHGFFTQAEAFYFKAENSMRNDSLAVLELGRCYKFARKYDKAIDVLGRSLNNFPTNNKLHYELKDVFLRLKSNEKTISFYEEFLSQFPENLLARRFLADAYLYAGGEYYLNNQIKRSIEYYNKALVSDPQRKEQINSFIEIIKSNTEGKKGNSKPKFCGFLKVKKVSSYFPSFLFGQRIVTNILEENLDKMAEICQKSNIEIFFSGYPDSVSGAMKRVALSNNIVLIEHKEVFDSFLKWCNNKDLFVSDNDRHCTKYGYRVMAENISEVILSVMPPETEKK